MTTTPEHDLLKAGEVAALFRVSPDTVRKWDTTGVLPAVRTLGGHRRWRRDVVEAALRSAGHEVA